MMYKIQNPAIAGGNRSKSGKPKAYMNKYSKCVNSCQYVIKQNIRQATKGPINRTLITNRNQALYSIYKVPYDYFTYNYSFYIDFTSRIGMLSKTRLT